MLERVLGDHSHLAGESFTYADMLILPILDYLQSGRESRAAIEAAPHLRRYFEVQAQRPSFIETAPPPFAELRN